MITNCSPVNQSHGWLWDSRDTIVWIFQSPQYIQYSIKLIFCWRSQCACAVCFAIHYRVSDAESLTPAWMKNWSNDVETSHYFIWGMGFGPRLLGLLSTASAFYRTTRSIFLFSRDQNKFICCEMYCFRINILASPDNRQRPSGLLTVIVWTLRE